MRRRGFTLIELLVVMAVLALLLAIAVPRFGERVDRSREVVLKENLMHLRTAIDQYHADRGRYPDTLEELVKLRYLREAPMDPITERSDTWAIVAPPSGADAGTVYDVHSGSEGTARDGSRFDTW